MAATSAFSKELSAFCIAQDDIMARAVDNMKTAVDRLEARRAAQALRGEEINLGDVTPLLQDLLAPETPPSDSSDGSEELTASLLREKFMLDVGGPRSESLQSTKTDSVAWHEFDRPSTPLDIHSLLLRQGAQSGAPNGPFSLLDKRSSAIFGPPSNYCTAPRNLKKNICRSSLADIALLNLRSASLSSSDDSDEIRSPRTKLRDLQEEPVLGVGGDPCARSMSCPPCQYEHVNAFTAGDDNVQLQQQKQQQQNRHQSLNTLADIANSPIISTLSAANRRRRNSGEFDTPKSKFIRRKNSTGSSDGKTPPRGCSAHTPGSRGRAALKTMRRALHNALPKCRSGSHTPQSDSDVESPSPSALKQRRHTINPVRRFSRLKSETIQNDIDCSTRSRSTTRWVIKQ